VFALVAVPLGAQPRRGGRAAGSLIAVVVIASYYLMLVMGAGLAARARFCLPKGFGSPTAVLKRRWVSRCFPRMEQFRGESRWLRPFGYIKKWIRLQRRRQGGKPGRGRRLRAFTNGDRQEIVAPSGGSSPV